VYSYQAVDIFENRRALKPIYLVPATKLEILRRPDEQLHRLKDPDFDPESSLVLSESPVFGGPSSLPPSSRLDNIDFHADGTVVAHVQVAVPSVLVVSQFYYPGWKVRVDEVAKPVLTANFSLMGVALDPGVHDVQFQFSSTTIHLGIAVSIATIIICAI